MKPQALLALLLVAALGAAAWFLFDLGGSPAPVDVPGANEAAPTHSRDTGTAGIASADVDEQRRDAAESATPTASERTEVHAGGGTDAGRPRITGRLVDAEGLPRVGVELTVSTWNLRGMIQVVDDTPGAETDRLDLETDADGRFSFVLEGARSGNFSLKADELVFAERASFEGNGADQDLGDLVVVGAATVAGVVQDENGSPVAGVRVSAELGPMGFGSTSTMESRDDGTFLLGKLRPGTWTLRAASGQFLPGVAEQKVEADQHITGVLITLAPGAAVTGRVVDDRGVGVAGMKVVSQRKERSGEMEIVRFSDEESVTTDANGAFRLAGLDGERATLKAYGDGHSTAVQTVDTGTSGVELQVMRMGSVAGVLVTAAGEPIAGSRVRAYVDEQRSQTAALVEGLADLEIQRNDDARGKTDEQGRFVLANVEPGNVRIEAKGRGHLPAERRGLQVRPAQRLEGVRLVADAGAVARIEVVDQEGNPIRGAQVDVTRAPKRQMPGMRIETRTEGNGPGDFLLADRRRLGSARTDEHGVATIAGLPAADAVVAATHAQFAPADQQRVALPASGSVSQRLVMHEPGYVEVSVTRTDGAAAAGIPVMLQAAGASGDEALDRRNADAEGRVRFGPLRAGDYTAVLAREPQARRAGNMMMFLGNDQQRIASSAQQVLVAAGKTASVELEMPVLTRLTGRVIGSEGAAAGVVVEIESSDDEDAALGFGGRSATTDGDGNFAFDGVEAGGYEVRYGKPGQVVKAKLDLDVPPNTPELHRDLSLRTGSLRIAVRSKEDADPVERAEVRLVRQGAPGAPKPQRRPRRIMMVSVTADGDGGESSSTMTLGNQRVVTDADGVATFEDVPVGNYTVEIESGKFAPFRKPDVAIVERQRTDCGTVEVAPAGQVRGVVEDQDGKRAMSMVQCRAAGTEEWTKTEMAMQGTYRLRGLAPGRYEVRARPIGVQAGEPSQPVVVEVVAGKTKVADLKVKK
jgi:protocatechuate 3,4-dioxygenase beta subunit